jgi:hypothetical protein
MSPRRRLHMTQPPAPEDRPTRTAVQCLHCPGWLIAPASIAAGMGKACARHQREAAARAAAELPLFTLEELEELTEEVPCHGSKSTTDSRTRRR